MKNFKILPADIVRKEVDGTHYYFVGDTFYPSVTHILDVAGPKEYGLLNFFKQNTPDEIEKIKTETAGFGTMLHDAFEKLLWGVELNTKDYPERANKILMQFQEWFNILHPTKYLPEHTVAYDLRSEIDPQVNDIADPEVRWAGTLDIFATVKAENLVNVPNLFSKTESTEILNGARFEGKDEILLLADFKTTSGIYYTHKAQVGAYVMAVEQMYGRRIDLGAVVRFGTRHTCGYEMKMVDLKVYKQAFMDIFNIYKSMNDGKMPEPPVINVYPETIKLIDADPLSSN